MSRPTLLSSCAAAATAKEARFRIDAARGVPRATRVVSLDPGAAEVVAPLQASEWRGAEFLQDATPSSGRELIDPDDLVLLAADGRSLRLRETLAEADFVLLVATTGAGAAAASAIGMACSLRGITTAGVIHSADETADSAVRALRPHARVLLVSHDQEDVAGLLEAVGA